ncbi:(Fe-S)-binding protein [Paenibacillus yanchengensis]|uniref:Glycolate oxidase iron-sulfur subunit n=1 Tax=Paenibacillus yanchengensis TaxID=2035833 RepID=A0ABW4YPF8_9BACL
MTSRVDVVEKPSNDKKSKTEALRQTLKVQLDYDQLTNCMRCGFCLPACPTFKITGMEAESPRGRISLMKAAVDGLMEPGIAFEDQMNHCLGCRACEPACPADVKYGQLIEQAKDAIEKHTTQHRTWVKGLRYMMLKKVVPNQKRMQLVGRGLQLYKKSGLQKFVQKTGAAAVLSAHMKDMEMVIPDGSGKGVVEQLGTFIPAKGIAEKVATVAMFRGCMMDTMFYETNRKTIALLSEAGFDIVIPETQRCCGAMQAHSGEVDVAKAQARDNIKAFRNSGADFIVSNAGGCGALLVEYDILLKDEPEYQADATWFAKRVLDVSTLLMKHGRKLTYHYNTSGETTTLPIVTYQDSCHLRNVMKGGEAPRQLLKQVSGIQLVEMKAASSCCGSAGTYNLTQPEMANQILEHKMCDVNETMANRIITSNPGCQLQMQLGVNKHGNNNEIIVEHIIDFLYDCLQRVERVE